MSSRSGIRSMTMAVNTVELVLQRVWSQSHLFTASVALSVGALPSLSLYRAYASLSEYSSNRVYFHRMAEILIHLHWRTVYFTLRNKIRKELESGLEETGVYIHSGKTALKRQRKSGRRRKALVLTRNEMKLD